MNANRDMRTQMSGRAQRATLWDRDRAGSYHTRCDICRAPARSSRAGMLLCRDCLDAARPHRDDDAYDDMAAGD